MIRTIFMGTPQFAVPALLALFEISEVIAVITKPDEPVGRKKILVPPPIKVEAQKRNVLVLQPEKIRDPQFISIIRDLQPDLIVVAAYGKIIPRELLALPRYGTINVHASLLPKYRGASPKQAAILAGESETGVTIMLIDELLDHGPILAQATISIAPDETGGSLTEKLATVGAKLLAATIPEWVAGRIKPQEQDHAKATMTKLLTRDDGKIDWSKPADYIERLVRVYDPWPGAWTTVWIKDLGLRIKVLKARLQPKSYNLNPKSKSGTLFKTPHGLAVVCSTGSLELLKLQVEGKRPISAREFINGYPDIIGSQLL